MLLLYSTFNGLWNQEMNSSQVILYNSLYVIQSNSFWTEFISP